MSLRALVLLPLVLLGLLLVGCADRTAEAVEAIEEADAHLARYLELDAEVAQGLEAVEAAGSAADASATVAVAEDLHVLVAEQAEEASSAVSALERASTERAEESVRAYAAARLEAARTLAQVSEQLAAYVRGLTLLAAAYESDDASTTASVLEDLDEIAQGIESLRVEYAERTERSDALYESIGAESE